MIDGNQLEKMKKLLEHPEYYDHPEIDKCPHKSLIFAWKTGVFYCPACHVILFQAIGISANMSKDVIKFYG